MNCRTRDLWPRALQSQLSASIRPSGSGQIELIVPPPYAEGDCGAGSPDGLGTFPTPKPQPHLVGKSAKKPPAKKSTRSVTAIHTASGFTGRVPIDRRLESRSLARSTVPGGHDFPPLLSMRRPAPQTSLFRLERTSRATVEDTDQLT
jgi:hypothetical protein